MTTTRLFIVRHAEHVKPGETNLSRVGSLQAAALAETFRTSKTKFDAIYASSRCTETAENIAHALGLPLTIDERLRSWQGGAITGLTKEQVKEKLPDIYLHRYIERDPEFRVSPDAENLKERYNRVDDFLKSIVHG